LQGLDNFLGYFLLLFETLSAGDGFSAPKLVLLRHAIYVVCNVVDRFAKRVSRLAEHLDSFLHKFDVVLVETASPSA
jgi:hypothetical protein